MSGSVGNNVGRGSGIIVAAAGGLASGTKTDFFQAAAPTDWTQDATNNDKMLRVVSGTGGGTGGTAAISSPAHNLAAGSHTMVTAEMPSHTHHIHYSPSSSGYAPSRPRMGSGYSNAGPVASGGTGGGGGHLHSLSGSVTASAYLDVIIATKD